MTKKCSRCRQDKEVTEFAQSKTGSQGYNNYCRVCSKEYYKNYQRVYKKPDINMRRNWTTKHYYGISWQDVLDRVAEQGGRCLGCLEKLDAESPRGIAIDHDHACCGGSKSCGDCVRGILCMGCNWALGHARDNPETLNRLAEYLNGSNNFAL